MSDEFAGLLDIEPVSHVTKVPEWEGEIPGDVVKFVTKVLHTGKIYPVPANDKNILRLKSVFTAALKHVAPHKSPNIRVKLNDDGGVTGFSFSVGDKRGRKEHPGSNPVPAEDNGTR